MRVRYQTFEFGTTDIHVRTLRDRQQYSDDEGIAEKLGVSAASWPLFGVVWPSGELLAHLMHDHDIDGKRILEVGCGIGLPSLVLNHRGADITATDYHPEVADFLQENVRLNDDAEISFVRTGWDEASTGMGLFDLIIGSDLLYEPDQANLLSAFIDQHSGPRCEVIIVDPGRGLYPRFSINMMKMGFSYGRESCKEKDHVNGEIKAKILVYSR